MRKDYQKAKQDGTYQSAEDKAMDRFVDLMIGKLNEIQHDWKKPWFSGSAVAVPRNLSGRQYNGMNSVMLMLHAQKMNYNLPVWATFDRVASLNFVKDKEGKKQQAKDGNGEKLPQVSIKKGEKSFPVFITTFSVVNNETKERIKYDDYRQMSEEERAKYHVYPKLQVYSVFNVDQTNIKEARPELYAKLEEQVKGQKRSDVLQGEVMPAVDAMIKQGGWYCPIKEVEGDEAYYSISKDHIVVPTREQFKNLESFQGNLFHECAHSSGSENRLNRIKPSSFGSKDYAAEELKAELTAAFVSANYGMVKGLKEDSAPYIKSWLGSLNESPDFLKTILLDVKRASSLLTQRIDGIQQRIDQGLEPIADEWKEEHESIRTASTKVMGQDAKASATQSSNVAASESQSQPKEETVAAKLAPTSSAQKEPTYYASVAYLQSTDDTQLFDRLQEQGDYKRILHEAAEYDFGDAPDLSQTYKSPTQSSHDDLLDEDDHYAVVYNAAVGGTYEVFRKLDESEVRENLIRYGQLDNATKDVKAVAAKMPEFQTNEQEETVSHRMHR